MRTNDSGALDLRIRAIFWAIALVLGAFATYTTSYFINGDAVAYTEIADGMRRGDWSVIANVTYSPGYSIPLAVGQVLLGTTPENEVYLLKWVNFGILCLTLVLLEFFLARVGSLVESEDPTGAQPNALTLWKLLGRAMFLVAALLMIRVQTMTADMLIFAFVLACMTIILGIREDPWRYSRYGLLGLVCGMGYACKEVFWVFSVMFFCLAGLCSPSFRHGIPRVLLGVLVTLVVAAPLVGARSYKLGRLSHGELGKFAYAYFVSGEGEPFRPDIVHRYPDFLRYDSGQTVARERGFDHCYWYEGFRPRFDPKTQAAIIINNVLELGRQNRVWMFSTILFFAALGVAGLLRIGALSPTSLLVLLTVPALLCTGMYCLIHMEPRYVAPFLFLGFVALATRFKWPEKLRIAPKLVWILVGAFVLGQLSVVMRGVARQASEGLISDNGRVSHRDRFREQEVVREFLASGGIKQGDRIGLIGSAPVYWARMGGWRITVEPRDDQEFIKCTPEQRSEALRDLKEIGLKAVVAYGVEYAPLSREGWCPVPGSHLFFVAFLGAPPTRTDGTRPQRMSEAGRHVSRPAVLPAALNMIHEPQSRPDGETR